MALWVIPCKYTGEPLVQACVDSIRAHHPSDEILVVDACSDDRSYLDDLKLRGVHVATGNKNYCIGAWRYARTFKWDFAYFIQDSTELTANISHIEDKPCSVYRLYGQEQNTELTEYQNKVLAKLRIPEPPAWRVVMGPMLMCQRSVFQQLRGAGLFQVLPRTKAQANAYERLVGMLLVHLGIPVAHEVEPWLTKHYRERD